jgi:hypothetical protein
VNKILIALLAYVIFVSPYSPPQAIISNGLITAQLYLPDAENGYYRGTRFDWSGQIADLHYKGHSYFGQWFEKYDPYANDAIMGPVEAFDPIGYEDAKVGERFIKIGVGALQKPQEDNYFFANDYPLANGGKWEIQQQSRQVTFKHTFKEADYGYVYTKIVKLSKNKPELLLEHTLKNTGSKTIETNVMNHNFFVIDSLTTGSDFIIKFPFDIREQQTNEHKDAHVIGKEIHLEGGDPHGKQFFLDNLKGYTTDAKDYNITLSHEKSGTSVTVTSDRPFERLNFWASVKTICPEPFIHIKAEPGQSFQWTTTYQFKAK